jgi:hypothetical protein
METAKKTSRRSESKASDDKIKAAYIESVLTHGARPVSVYKFCVDFGIKEGSFTIDLGRLTDLKTIFGKVLLT